jgi:hypothetical protein
MTRGPLGLALLTLASIGGAACASSPAAPPPATATVTATTPTTATTPAPPPAPPPAPLTVTDLLTKNRAPFDACYAMAKKVNPNLLRTNVEITFNMDDSGKLIDVDFAYRNRFDDAAKDCMRRAAESMNFPASLHGKQTGTITFTPP